jgi:hypothetical protein
MHDRGMKRVKSHAAVKRDAFTALYGFKGSAEWDVMSKAPVPPSQFDVRSDNDNTKIKVMVAPTE